MEPVWRVLLTVTLAFMIAVYAIIWLGDKYLGPSPPKTKIERVE